MANMIIDTEKLLSDQRVVDEIRRHLWIESEKAGYDIGFEKAKQDWLEKFSKAWMSYNMPDALIKARKVAVAKNNGKVVEAKDKSQRLKRRRAKSYL
jgi:hypothetical protein